MSSTTREINLFCKNGYFLQINDKGEMSGTHAKGSKFAVIKVSAVDHGVVTMQAVVSGVYVAVDSTGKVHTKKLFTEESLFYEECSPAHGYISYRSFRYGKRKYYLGISRRGKVRPASKILADQNCAKFLHLNARETDEQKKTKEQTIEEEQIKKALAAQVQMQQVSRKVGLTKSQKQEARKEALKQQKLEQPEVKTTIPSEKKRKKKKKKPAEEDLLDEKDQDTSVKAEGKQKQEDVNQAKKKVNQTAGEDKPDKTNSNDQTAKKQKLSETKEQPGKNRKQIENKDKPVKTQKQTGDKDHTKKKEKQTGSKDSNATQSEDSGKDQKMTKESQKGESYKKKETPTGNTTVKGPKQESDKVTKEVVDQSTEENSDKGETGKKSKDKTAKKQEQKESSADKTPRQPMKTTAADEQLKMASTESKADKQPVEQADTKDSLEKKEERAENRKEEKKEDKKKAKKEDKKKDKKGDKKEIKEEKKDKNGQSVQTADTPLEVIDQSKKNESLVAERSTGTTVTTPKRETTDLVEDEQSTKTPDKDQKQPAKEGQTDVKKKTAKKRSNDDQQEMQSKLETEIKTQGERKDGKKDKQAKKSAKSEDDGQTEKKQKKTQAKTDEEGAKKPKQETSGKKPEKVDRKDQGTKNNEDIGAGDVAAKPPKEKESYQPESKLTAAESSDKSKAATIDQETKKNKKKKKQKTNNADAKTDQKSEQLQQQSNEATGASKPKQTVDITTTVVQEQIPVEDSQLVPQDGIVAQTSMVDSEPKPEANEVVFGKQEAAAELSQPQQPQELNNNQEDSQPDSSSAIGIENQLPSEVSYTATSDAEEIQPLLYDSVEFEESSLPPSFGTSLGSQEQIASQLQVDSSGNNIPTSTPTWSDIVQQQPPQIDHQQVGSSKTEQVELAEQAVSLDAPNTARDIPGQISIDREQMKTDSASSPSWSDIVQQSPQAVNDGAVPVAEQHVGSEQRIYSCQDTMAHSNVPGEHPAQGDISLPVVQQELPHIDKDEVLFDGLTQQSQTTGSLDPNQSTAPKHDSLSDEQTSAQTNAEQVITDKAPTWSDIVQQPPQQTVEAGTRTSVNQTNQASVENHVGSPDNSTNQDQVPQPAALPAGNVPSDFTVSQTPTWSDIVQSSPQQIVQGETEVNTSQDKAPLPKELTTGQVTEKDPQMPLPTTPTEPEGKNDSSSADFEKQVTEAGQEQKNKRVGEAVPSEQPTSEENIASGVRIDDNLSIPCDTQVTAIEKGKVEKSPTFSDIIQQQSLQPLQSLPQQVIDGSQGIQSPPSVPEPKSEASEDIMRDPTDDQETVLAASVQSEPDVWEQYMGGHEESQDLAPVVSGPTESDVWEQYTGSPEGKQELVPAAPVQSKGHMGIPEDKQNPAPVVSAPVEPNVWEQYMESPKGKEGTDHKVPASMEPDVWEQYMERPEDKKDQAPAFPASTEPDVWEQYIGSPEDIKDQAPTVPASMEPDVWEQYMESPEDKKDKASVASAPTEPDVSEQNTGGPENKKEQGPAPSASMEPDVSEQSMESPEDKQGIAPAFPHQTTPDIWEDFLSGPEDTQIDTSMVSTQMQDTKDPDTSENKETEVGVQFSEQLDKGQEKDKQNAPTSGDGICNEQQMSENQSAEVNRENQFYRPQNNTLVPDTMVGQPSFQGSEALKEPVLQMQQQDETNAAPILPPLDQPPPGLPPLQQQPPELATPDPYAQELEHRDPSATTAAAAAAATTTTSSIQAPTPTNNSAVPYDHPWTANFNQQQSVNIPMEPETNIWEQYMGSGGVATGVEQKQSSDVWDQYMTPMGFMDDQEARASTMQFAHAFFEDDINDDQQHYDSTGQQPSQQNIDAVTGQSIIVGQQPPENIDFGTSVDGPQSQVHPQVGQNLSSQDQIPQAAAQPQLMQEPCLDHHAGFSDNSFGQSMSSPQQQFVAQNTESQSANMQTAPIGNAPPDMATDGNVQLPEQPQVVQQVAVESPATNTNNQEFAEGAQVEEALEASMLDDLHID